MQTYDENSTKPVKRKYKLVPSPYSSGYVPSDIAQRLEQKISETKHALSTSTIARQDAQTELTDLVRSRTELECTIADLQSAGEQEGGRRAELEKEITTVEHQISSKERELGALIPQWSDYRTREAAEKRKMEDTKAQLSALFAKQGRVKRFRTKAERDNYLHQEIASLESYQKNRVSVLESTKGDLTSTREALSEVTRRIDGLQDSVEDGKKRVRDLGDQLSELKDKQSDFAERRKELWREDSKLDGLLSHAADELKSAERNLASMMDKVCPCAPFKPSVRTNRIFHRILVRVFELLIEFPNDITWRGYMGRCIVSLKSPTRHSVLRSSLPPGTGNSSFL